MPGRISSVSGFKGKQCAGVVESSDEEDHHQQQQQQQQRGDHAPLRLPKYGDVDKQYLYQPVNNDIAGTKIRTLTAELNNARKDLMLTIGELRDVAILFATNEASADSQRDDDEDQFDNDNIPQDSVSYIVSILLLDSADATVFPGSKKDDMKRLDKEVRNALDQYNETKIRIDTLNDLRQKMAQGHEIVSSFQGVKLHTRLDAN